MTAKTVSHYAAVLAAGGLWLAMIVVMSLLGTALGLEARPRDY